MPVDTKSDMERIGLFSEMGYVTIGDKYVPRYMRPFNEAASKNRQMLTRGTKTLSALQEGYFEPQFLRIFEGEAYSDPVRLRRRHRLAESKKNVGKPFRPSSGDKLPCGVGSYYGTIGGSYKYFSSELTSKGSNFFVGKNLYTNPGKKGSGFGYANLTIGKQYPYEPDEYDAERIKAKKAYEEHKRLFKAGPFKLNLYPRKYFDTNPYFNDKPLPPVKKSPPQKLSVRPFIPSSPAKKLGGMKGGTFDRYPSYSAEPYMSKKSKAATTGKERQVFHLSFGPKSRPVTSIVHLNVTR
ncbi:CD047 protein, partial [Ramphastos sulfuratus]|nr:CD047 protein [Ramphastos sulfuratus]